MWAGGNLVHGERLTCCGGKGSKWLVGSARYGTGVLCYYRSITSTLLTFPFVIPYKKGTRERRRRELMWYIVDEDNDYTVLATCASLQEAEAWIAQYAQTDPD